MSTPHNDQTLGAPLRSKKKRSAVFIVIVASVLVHVLAGLGLAAVKIIEVLQPEPEFEAPPIVEAKPPPPPPPTTKRAQRSLPRPQPLAARNPQNMSVPAIEINNSDLSMAADVVSVGGSAVSAEPWRIPCVSPVSDSTARWKALSKAHCMTLKKMPRASPSNEAGI